MGHIFSAKRDSAIWDSAKREDTLLQNYKLLAESIYHWRRRYAFIISFKATLGHGEMWKLRLDNGRAIGIIAIHRTGRFSNSFHDPCVHQNHNHHNQNHNRFHLSLKNNKIINLFKVLVFIYFSSNYFK